MSSGRHLRALSLQAIVATQVALWLWRWPQLVAALDGQPLGLAVAAWGSIWVTLAAWVVGWPVHPGVGPARRGPWRDFWTRLTARRATRLGLHVAGIYTLVALLAPALAPHDPNRIGDGVATHSLAPLSRLHLIARRDGSIIAANQVELAGEAVRIRRGAQWTELPRHELVGAQPSDWHRTRLHILGTDRLGRDLLSRVLVGSRVSLGIGLLSALLPLPDDAEVGGGGRDDQKGQGDGEESGRNEHTGTHDRLLRGGRGACAFHEKAASVKAWSR